MPDLHIIIQIKTVGLKATKRVCSGVASNNNQNADRWSNTTENGGTNWDGDQYYQKKIDTNVLREIRYPVIYKAAFGDNGEWL